MALDVPRGVQKPTLRVWLPVGVCTAALGTKSKPWLGLEGALNLSTRI